MDTKNTAKTVPMLEIKGAHKVFGRGTPNEHLALDHLDLSLEEGDFVTIVGSNGAGKSTLFNAVCGTFFLDEGRIRLGGEDITYMKEHRRSRVIGRVFQDPMKGTAPNMTIEENLSLAYARVNGSMLGFALNKKDVAVFREALAQYHMGLEDRMKTKVGLLSGGQRQVVTMLMCTIVTPRLLLLDEHTAALDPATAAKIMEITREVVEKNHITTMMITHNLKQAMETGNRTIMMDEGQIILDVNEAERSRMTVDDLLARYSAKKQESFDNDRILLTK